jgi:WD40 repeat protein
VTRCAALTRDGAQAALVTAATDGSGPDSLELWDAAQGRILRLGRAPAGTRALVFSDDARLLLAAAADGTVRLYVVKALREVDRVDLQANGEHPTAVAFAPDGLSFLVGTSVGALQHYLIVADPNR